MKDIIGAAAVSSAIMFGLAGVNQIMVPDVAYAGPKEDKVVYEMRKAGLDDATVWDAFGICLIERNGGDGYTTWAERFPNNTPAEIAKGMTAALTWWCPAKK